jgi:hypothetical protein
MITFAHSRNLSVSRVGGWVSGYEWMSLEERMVCETGKGRQRKALQLSLFLPLSVASPMWCRTVSVSSFMSCVLCIIIFITGMLRTIVMFYDLSLKAITESPAEDKVTYNKIRTHLGPLIHKITSMKFVDPKSPVEVRGVGGWVNGHE